MKVENGHDILKQYIKNGEIHLNQEQTNDVLLLLDLIIDYLGQNGFKMSLSDYLDKVLDILNSGHFDEDEEKYTKEFLIKHLDHFSECWRSGISAYKAVVFLHD